MDVHKYVWPNPSQAGQPDHAMEEVFDNSQVFRGQYPSTNTSVPRKPFNHGESNYFTDLSFGGQNYNIEKLFHNYDVSFHNELWSSAFSGNFATSLTWHWERVFWWPDALPVPPQDDNNLFQGNRSNVSGATNWLQVNGSPIPVINHTIYHNFKPLANLLAGPDFQSLDLLNWDYIPHKVHDETSGLECYYLTGGGVSAVGWVHNLNAWVMNSYYLASGVDYENFLGCTAPAAQVITLPGFAQDHDYYITWYPTRMNATAPPPATTASNLAGEVILDLSAAPLGSIVSNYLDTLHADYAFIISPAPLLRSMPTSNEMDTLDGGWDFVLYPNPADNALNVLLPDDAPTDIAIHDLSGRLVLAWGSVSGPLLRLPVGELARSAYYVRVSDGLNTKVKKLIIR